MGPVPALDALHGNELRVTCSSDEAGEDNKDDGQRYEIERQNAQGPPAIEIARGVFRPATIQEDFSNEQARQNEKEVDSCPAAERQFLEPFAEPVRHQV